MSFDDLLAGLPDADTCKATANRVSEFTSKLSERASAIAESLGLRGSILQIGGIENPKTLEEMLSVLMKPASLFRITRVGDIWDVFYSETVTLSTIGKQEWQRISSCRWETKALFLKHAPEIFSAYFKHVNEFIENVPFEIAKADALLKELRELIQVPE